MLLLFFFGFCRCSLLWVVHGTWMSCFGFGRPLFMCLPLRSLTPRMTTIMESSNKSMGNAKGVQPLRPLHPLTTIWTLRKNKLTTSALYTHEFAHSLKEQLEIPGSSWCSVDVHVPAWKKKNHLTIPGPGSGSRTTGMYLVFAQSTMVSPGQTYLFLLAVYHKWSKVLNNLVSPSRMIEDKVTRK